MTGESDPALRYYRSEPILMEFLRVKYLSFIGCHEVKPLDVDNMANIRRFSQCIKSASEGDVDESERFFNCCKLSFDSMVSQTEYQDGKAVRILTIMTFLSVVTVLMFKFGLDPKQIGVSGFTQFTFGCLLLYVSITILGVMFTLHAIQTRFNHIADPSGLPGSLTFFKTVSNYSPEDFVGQFGIVREGGDGKDLIGLCSKDLYLRLSQDFIAESYLISGKIVRKIGFLRVGIMFFKYSSFPVVAWILMTVYYYISGMFELFFK